ncbi:MAG: hypothetical protein E1N59_2433 [Puniceicoccaceae bacterium 5H]|nr:MAG: hypothetical protein E1N59_2433 [Puniceicoccaceae bacterium 5H]
MTVHRAGFRDNENSTGFRPLRQHFLTVRKGGSYKFATIMTLPKDFF